MRWLAIAVAFLALVLVGAGCGGDDEAASDTTTLTDTTTDDTTTDETTTEETTDDDSGDFDPLASEECADLVEASTQLSQAFGAATPSDEDYDDVSTFFDEFAENAPEEIRADFQVLADAWEELAEILPELQVDAGETPDPEALLKLQQAIASLDQQEVSAASQSISEWTTENCTG